MSPAGRGGRSVGLGSVAVSSLDTGSRHPVEKTGEKRGDVKRNYARITTTVRVRETQISGLPSLSLSLSDSESMRSRKSACESWGSIDRVAAFAEK